MAEMQTLVVAPRDATTNKALRRTGSVPAVVYGRDFEAQSVQVVYRTLAGFLRAAGASSMFTLKVEDQSEEHMVLIREIQRDPVTDHIIHLDFYRVVAGEAIRNTVPIVMVGTAPALELGATVGLLIDELEIECLPKDMPDHIEVDVSGLEQPGQSISVVDLILPAEVTVLTAEDMVVVQAVAQRAIEEEEEPEVAEGEVAVEGEGEGDGEATAEAASAEAASE